MAEIDEKALEAAARVYAKQQGKNPDECAFGHGVVGENGSSFVCDVTWLEACLPSARHVISTYLSASPAHQSFAEGVEAAAKVAETRGPDDDRIDMQIRQQIAAAIRALKEPST